MVTGTSACGLLLVALSVLCSGIFAYVTPEKGDCQDVSIGLLSLKDVCLKLSPPSCNLSSVDVSVAIQNTRIFAEKVPVLRGGAKEPQRCQDISGGFGGCTRVCVIMRNLRVAENWATSDPEISLTCSTQKIAIKLDKLSVGFDCSILTSCTKCLHPETGGRCGWCGVKPKKTACIPGRGAGPFCDGDCGMLSRYYYGQCPPNLREIETVEEQLKNTTHSLDGCRNDTVVVESKYEVATAEEERTKAKLRAMEQKLDKIDSGETECLGVFAFGSTVVGALLLGSIIGYCVGQRRVAKLQRSVEMCSLSAGNPPQLHAGFQAQPIGPPQTRAPQAAAQPDVPLGGVVAGVPVHVSPLNAVPAIDPRGAVAVKT